MVFSEKEKMEATKAPFLDHLKELRTRLLYCLTLFFLIFLIAYYYAKPIYGFLVQPLVKADGTSQRLIYTGLTEAFFTYMEVAFFAALCVSFPFVAFQIYRFMSPGLYVKEKSFLRFCLLASPLLFLSGAMLAYYGIIPLAWSFFLGFEHTSQNGVSLQLEARVSEYLSLMMHILFAFGVAFQLPIIIMLLAKLGFVTSRLLILKRRYAIVVIFIVAAILTPPDVVSQIGLALPLWLLYEFSILSCKFIEKKQTLPQNF